MSIKSRFLFPYYYDGNHSELFDERWQEEGTETRYLADYINKYFNGLENNKSIKICHHYVMPVKREIKMTSDILPKRVEYRFILDSIEAYHFASGSGCLICVMRHMDSDDLVTITGKSFAFSRIFQNSHWVLSSTGAVPATYIPENDRNRKFLLNYHSKNIERSYLTLFLLDFEERETLLYYNSKVAENWNNIKELEKRGLP